jgi:oxygen-independent coproporphyrinogen-3 oxidase
MPLGLYVSIPFCRTKCSFCNFASGVFSRARYQEYTERVCGEIARGRELTAEPVADSIYFGGGTPTVLDTTQLEQIFGAIRDNFEILPETEITVECAPGTLSQIWVETLVRCEVNRVSLGVQSFVDRESSSVGRLHTRAIVLEDIARFRDAGISNISIDLIAGLPHQTAESWQFSLDEAIASGAPHVSVYMLEVDDDSRLGRELIAGGTRYHAHHVPDEDLTASMYEAAWERLSEAGVAQYEISNFAREGFMSRHNLKYWTRQPYLGFGVDAHSMLREGGDGVRFCNPDSLEGYMANQAVERHSVSRREALEETFFLGLRLMRGVCLAEIEVKFEDDLGEYLRVAGELTELGLFDQRDGWLRLTERGKLLSNEVFQRFIAVPQLSG